MDKVLLNEIIECLPSGRTIFRYARDDYALMLLSFISARGLTITDAKRSEFRGLLDKVAVKSLLKHCGDGTINPKLIEYFPIQARHSFLLTLGNWDASFDGFSQTTCENANLVLRLNFNASHDRAFKRWVGEDKEYFFIYEDHPILRKGERPYYRNTLAWARLDLDFQTGEVLIEEIQTDWLRYAKSFLRYLQNYIVNRPTAENYFQGKRSMQTVRQYMEEVLAPYYVIWDEAMLAATIKFCVTELGMTRIYYHSFETGCQLKRIRTHLPPKSLYTTLPKRFCFQATDQVPLFLHKSSIARRKLKRIANPRWFLLAV